MKFSIVKSNTYAFFGGGWARMAQFSPLSVKMSHWNYLKLLLEQVKLSENYILQYQIVYFHENPCVDYVQFHMENNSKGWSGQ